MDRNLIFDVGCHLGEDADYYLRKGFRVVGVEAHPQLCAHLRNRFADAIADKRFTLVDKAIAEASGQVAFYTNEQTDWGTIKTDWVERNMRMGFASQPIHVDAVTFDSLLNEFGCPYYAKIDIEGADALCLTQMQTCNARPAYLSIEMDTVAGGLKSVLSVLLALGYEHFQVIDQTTIQGQAPLGNEGEALTDYRFPYHSSGAFGRDLPDAWGSLKDTMWLYRSIMLRYRLTGDFRSPLIKRVMRQARLGFIYDALHDAGWHDVHARHKSVSINQSAR